MSKFESILRVPFSWKFSKIGTLIAYSFVKNGLYRVRNRKCSPYFCREGVVPVPHPVPTSRLARSCPSHDSDQQVSLCSILFIGCVKFCSRLYVGIHSSGQKRSNTTQIRKSVGGAETDNIRVDRGKVKV